MNRPTGIRLLAACLFTVFLTDASCSQTGPLRQEIENIVKTKQADVGVAIYGLGNGDTLTLNGNKHYPMQSVFKFHIALAVLSRIDKGGFSFDQKIEIAKKDLLPGLYSPIRDKYPNGATLMVSEIMD